MRGGSFLVLFTVAAATPLWPKLFDSFYTYEPKIEIFNTTLGFFGGEETCEQCWYGSPVLDYACSDNDGDWGDGILLFPDFLPEINKSNGDWSIQQINFTLIGAFDCIPGGNKNTSINFLFQDTNVGSMEISNPNWANLNCAKCPNCVFEQGFVGNLFLEGISLPNYNYGGSNKLQLLVQTNVVCISNLTISLKIQTGPFVPVLDLNFHVFTPLMVALIALASVIFALVAAVVVFTLYARCRRTYAVLPVVDPNAVSAGDISYRERIGRGSMGIVYRGYWKGVEVAIKKLPLDHTNPEAFAQVLAEAKMMKQFRHPNILLYMGHVLETNDISIVTEYLARGSLYHTLHRASLPLSWSRRIGFALDAAKGMQYLHAFEPMVLHRDLKSANLLLDENWKVKVCDFGLSRLVENIASTMTVLRNQNYNWPADVYSFGITLWEICTRHNPYEGLPPFRVVFLVGTQGSRPPIPLDCHVGVAALMQRCWSEDPQDRPSFPDIVPVLTALLTEQLQLEGPSDKDEGDLAGHGIVSPEDGIGDPEPEPLSQ